MTEENYVKFAYYGQKISDHKGQSFSADREFGFTSSFENIRLTCLDKSKFTTTFTPNTNYGDQIYASVAGIVINTKLQNGNDAAAILKAYENNTRYGSLPAMTFPVEGNISVMDVICDSPIIQKVRKEGKTVPTK